MTGMRYTMSARSQGEPYTQRRRARLAGEDVRRRLTARPDGFHCDLRVVHTPHAVGPVCGRPFRSDDVEGGAM